MSSPAKLSAYILAYNEEKKIGATLASIQWVDEIVVLDSYSTDKTVEIAESYGAKVVQIEFKGFGNLRNEGLRNTTHDWIFSIDSDEQCTPGAEEEIKKIINAPDSADAYMTPRRNTFMGRAIKYCGWYPNYRQPQLFRRGKVTYSEEDLVHERYQVHGQLKEMNNAITQVPFRNLSEVMEKANRYSTLGAEKLYEKGRRTNPLNTLFRGVWAFLRIYIFRGGILDGWPGFLIALSNFEGTFYRYAKLGEIIRKRETEKLAKEPE